jgi:hypothetical protein
VVLIVDWTGDSAGPTVGLNKTLGLTESLDKRISGPYSRFGQETRWTQQSVWRTQQSAALLGSNHIIQPHANHYPVLVTAWWSQAVTNTSINHAQCCSTGAWYDHETTHGGKNVRPFYRPAACFIHSLVQISETGYEIHGCPQCEHDSLLPPASFMCPRLPICIQICQPQYVGLCTRSV